MNRLPVGAELGTSVIPGVKNVVDSLRGENPVLVSPAFNIEDFIQEQNLQVVPRMNLFELKGEEAVLSQCLKFVYVDMEHYESEIHFKRMRFSLACKLGDVFQKRGVFKEQAVHRCEMELLSRLFAGLLLVPADKLVVFLQKEPYFYRAGDYFGVPREVIAERVRSQDVAILRHGKTTRIELPAFAERHLEHLIIFPSRYPAAAGN